MQLPATWRTDDTRSVRAPPVPDIEPLAAVIDPLADALGDEVVEPVPAVLPVVAPVDGAAVPVADGEAVPVADGDVAPVEAPVEVDPVALPLAPIVPML